MDRQRHSVLGLREPHLSLATAPDGATIRVRATTTNKAGLSSSSDWMSVTIDRTGPELPADVVSCTSSRSTIAADAKSRAWLTTNDEARFCWTAPGFRDAGSGLRSLRWTLVQTDASHAAETWKAAATLTAPQSRLAATGGSAER